MKIGDIKSTERAFREVSQPHGEHVISTRSKWYSEIELSNVLRYLKISGGSEILDVGCSDGRFLEYIAARFPHAKLWGVDFAQSPLKILETKGFSKVPICADVSELPFKDSAFDGIAAIQAIYSPSRDERVKTFRELHRVMRQDGFAVITVLNRKWWHNLVENGVDGALVTCKEIQVHLYDPNTLRLELEDAGFEVKVIAGINNIPARYVKVLGCLGVLIDIFITRFLSPISLQRGCYLLASCVKK